jgi:dynamin 1-like protein
METDVIKLLITSYFNIVKRTIIDMVPKAIVLNLVRATKEGLQKELLEKIYQSDEVTDLLKESEFTVQRRREVQKMIASLEKAAEVVASV